MKNGMAYLQANNVLGIVHYYDTHQIGYEVGWPILTFPVYQLNAAPVDSNGNLIATSTTPLMTLVSQLDLGH
jgi:hypothetical protein